MKLVKGEVLAVLILSVAGCGGGGGGGDGNLAPAAAPRPTFTLSGVVGAASATAVDGDVNDPEAPYAPNDTLGTAQSIPNPVNLGGYVNQPGAGPAGRSDSLGDPRDFYAAHLGAGQVVTLAIAESTAQLELFVYDSPTDSSPDQAGGSGGVRSWTVPSPGGSYVLEVRAVAGASSYLLSIGQGLVPVGVRGTATSEPGQDFVPGELILRLREPGFSSETRSVRERANELGLSIRGRGRGRAMLARLVDDAGVERAYRALGIPGANRLQTRALEAMTDRQRRRWRTLRIIQALRQNAEVLYAEPNYILQPFLTPNDNLYHLQWHYPLINLPQAWDLTTGTNTVTVAVVDSGIIVAHSDLDGKRVGGYDFISDSGRALDGNGIDNDPSDPGGPLFQLPFHGTHVAGTVAAETNNTGGVAGAGWDVRLMPVRVLGPDGATLHDVLQAVQFAAGMPNDSLTVPAQAADVINLSLGGGNFSQAAQDVFTEVRNRGIIVIAAAGNEGTADPVYPAAYAGVVSVSAVDIGKSLAGYSSFGATIDVAAPGGDLSRDINGDGYGDGVLSTWADTSIGVARPTYAFVDGTSMAAPHVAGVAALMKAVDPALTPAEFDALLVSGDITEDLGAPGRDDLYGHGLIDAFRAVTAAGGTPLPPLPPALAVSPMSLNFGATETQAMLSVSNAGGGSLTVTSVDDNVSGSPDWLAVSVVSVDPTTQLGTYQVTVTRAGLTDGTYSGQVSFQWTGSSTTGGQIDVPVMVQVDTSPEDNDVGLQYVLLLDAATGVPLAQVALAASAGEYRFSFAGIPAGRYVLVAGSDSNNDGSICGGGEACGAYPSLDLPLTIEVSGNRTGLDFTSSFDAQPGSTSVLADLPRWDDTGQSLKRLGR